MFLAVFIPFVIIRSSRKLFHRTHLGNLDALDFILAFTLLFLFAYFTRQLLWIFTGQVTITISHEYMSVEKKVFGIIRTNKYALKSISKIYITENEDSNTFWNFGGIKHYDKSSKVLHLTVDGKTIDIGSKLEGFNPEIVKSEICSRQK
jgi:hypothetical protein